MSELKPKLIGSNPRSRQFSRLPSASFLSPQTLSGLRLTLPSGCNVSGKLLSIRKKLWTPYRACELAKAPIRQEFKRDNTTFKEGENKEAILTRALSYEFVDSFFPPWWTASDLSMSTPTRSPTPSLVDTSDIPSAKRRAYDIVVTCQHVEPFGTTYPA